LSALPSRFLAPLLATLSLCAAPPPQESLRDGRHDFDFLFGSWTIQNRRLVRRLHGSNEWQVFEARQTAWPVLGGLGNMDRFLATFPDGRAIEGMSLRFYDPESRHWSIYWVDDRSGQLQPPVVGRFTGSRGEFFGNDTFEGRPIRVRFRWQVVSPTEARWEQAFSPDGGQNWETNWTMQMSRISSEVTPANGGSGKPP
jgi:hypothetical protein